MQMKKLVRHIALLLLLFSVATACSMKDYVPEDVFNPDAPGSYYESAPPELDVTFLATIAKDSKGIVYLLSNGRKIEPLRPLEFTRRQRVMVKADLYYRGESIYAMVEWVEPLDEGVFTRDASVSGSDGLDVELDSSFTELDDGYLTLFYSSWWGEHPVHHDFYLVSGLKADDPYYLELRHNAHGDGKYSKEDGIISFDINSLPPTGDGTETIHIKWNTIEGNEVIASFEFKSRK